MVEVTVRNGEQLERALRRFKKKWERAGVLREIKRKSFYLKPSDVLRAARKNALMRRLRLARYNCFYYLKGSTKFRTFFLINILI